MDPIEAGKSRRVVALDLLRGAAVAGMILVTSPGDWNHAYAQLRHAAWNGWTLADMVFPAFLFAVGMALALAYPRTQGEATRLRLGVQVVRRALVLVVIGLALNLLAAVAFFDAAHVRLPGVLQRIGVAWALAATLLLATAAEEQPGRLRLRPWAVLAAAVLLLAGYTAALLWIPVPGYGTGRLDPAGSLPAYLDRLLFGVRHLWPYGIDAAGAVVYDPEGLLTTVPATVNVLFGVLAGWQWRQAPARALRSILLGGALLFVAGLLLDHWLPINKRLWTASFALLSSGFSAVALVLLALSARSATLLRLLWPLQVLGGNAILAFVLSSLLSIAGELRWLPGAGGAGVSPQVWGFDLAQRFIADPYLASFACALGVLALVTLLLAPLHARSIHMRV